MKWVVCFFSPSLAKTVIFELQCGIVTVNVSLTLISFIKFIN